MTREQRIEFVSKRLKLFIPTVVHHTMEATGAVRDVTIEIVNEWESELTNNEVETEKV